MELNKFIDHTLLKPQAVESEIALLCKEAKEYHFASVCVNPCNVAFVKKELAGSDVMTCSVIGFPFGTQASAVKCAETEQALKDGADEIDMVINVGKLLEGRLVYVENEIQALTDICHSHNAHLKVIVETCYLSEKDIANVCAAIENAGADFIKTSTGYGSRGASLEDIALFKKYLKKDTKIKASGGIRSREDAIKYIEAGCHRIGTSSGIKIVNG
ncbi:MAG: deoxyribose-phosphate aldolase [Treponema sp.]